MCVSSGISLVDHFPLRLLLEYLLSVFLWILYLAPPEMEYFILSTNRKIFWHFFSRANLLLVAEFCLYINFFLLFVCCIIIYILYRWVIDVFERIGFAVISAVRFCVMMLQQNVNNI